MRLEAQHLTKDFGNVHALDNLNFRFEGPGLIGYLGPNGAGKTTTLKLFAGLLHPTSGKVLVDGIEVQRRHKEAMSLLSALIETPEPYSHQSIGEFLKFIAKIRGIDDTLAGERIERLGKKLSLQDFATRCSDLSKGHRQRVVLAATLLPDTEMVILDEPTSGLDPAEARDTRLLLKELRKDKLILMSSHLLYEVTEVCDKIAFINRGKLLLIDSIKAIVEKFGKERPNGQRESIADLEDVYVSLIREGNARTS